MKFSVCPWDPSDERGYSVRNLIFNSKEKDVFAMADIFGTIGNDTLTGTTNPDVIAGGDGNDVIDGGLGSDSIDGGAGNDSLLGAPGNDTLMGVRVVIL